MHTPASLRKLASATLLVTALLAGGCRSPRGAATADNAAAQTNAVATAAEIEALTERAMKSLVVISHYGRDGQSSGVGAGFVIDPEGLIATSLHVIGEARPITVHLPGGQKHEITEVYAWDRKLDLAILRIAAKGLPALELGDSDLLKQGASVVALGNPQGLERSVVRGVLSARRDVEGNEMLQVAIPIEPGNSGGPLLDLDGRVHGVLTLKSAVTANLGFAMPVNSLKTLVEKPNPVPMNRWLTIGSLNEREWTAAPGARWTQRAGRIRVEGFGRGFGGRALCLARQSPPEPPYELAVTVKLDDESGAAGLVFGADGAERHYGFYPSARQLRLTRFDGPDVFSWQVLEQVPSKAYRPGDWNNLKVRVEKDRVLCYVNGELVIEAKGNDFAGSQVGLAKFRETVAEFKVFQVGRQVGTEAIPAELTDSLKAEIQDLQIHPGTRISPTIARNPAAGKALLLDQARRLEQQARNLRKAADAVHQQRIERELLRLFAQPDEKVDLAHAALLIAQLDNDELDITSYRQQLDRMTSELRARIKPAATAEEKLEELRKYLFQDSGFHGSRSDYYNRANSYLNEVMDDREGLPITLAVLFLELARRIDLPQVAATSTPGHLLVKFTSAEAETRLLDVFEGGKELSREEAGGLIEAVTGSRLRNEHLRTASKRELVGRILRNLMGITERSESPESGLRYLDLIVALNPESALERLSRGMMRLRSGDSSGAREDFKWLLDTEPPGLDLDRVAELYRSL